ncbi:MAG: VWA domain-containing protein [Archangium sp.]|nr:VWA domain-containing protein [Archangium sp.]
MRNASITACLTLFLSCGPSVVSDQPTSSSRCLSLTEPGGTTGLTASLPSRVGLLFKVDTCGGEPVSGLSGAQFEIFEDGKKVSAFESQQRVAPRGERFRLYSVVLLDLSGSMLRSGDFPQLQVAATRYLDEALAAGGDGHRIALMTFDGREQPQPLVPFTSDRAALQRGLDSLSATECSASSDCAAFSERRTCAGWRCVDDSTNLNGAIVSTLGTLDAELAQSDVTWRDGAVVLFTDGTDQAARASAAAAQEAVLRSAQHVFTIGLGGEVDERALEGLGKDGYWPVAKADQLDAAFVEIAGRVAGLANRFYVLEYCSPKRNGTHTLKVVATVDSPRDGRLVGSLSGQFDATGFASGCEL